jgi:DNA polymerase III delta subunit
MTTFLLHGENLVASRQDLHERVTVAKQAGKEVVRLDGAKIEVEDLIQALDSGTLFGGERLVVVENLLSRPKSGAQERLVGVLEGYAGENDLILWEPKEVGQRLVKHVPAQSQVKLFKIPALLFKFLDQIGPYRKKEALAIFADLIKQSSPELVFYMLARQFHLLIQAADGQKLAGPPWLTGKLKRQAEAFQKSSLLTNYEQLFTIDESIKTGQTVMPLEWHLSLFLLTI